MSYQIDAGDIRNPNRKTYELWSALLLGTENAVR